MSRSKAIEFFYTWIAPALLTVSCPAFFTLLDWLSQYGLEQNEALALLLLPMLILSITGLVFAFVKYKCLLLWIYVVLSIPVLLLLLLIGAASGASPNSY